jgi:hypothetical protein
MHLQYDQGEISISLRNVRDRDMMPQGTSQLGDNDHTFDDDGQVDQSDLVSASGGKKSAYLDADERRRRGRNGKCDDGQDRGNDKDEQRGDLKTDPSAGLPADRRACRQLKFSHPG